MKIENGEKMKLIFIIICFVLLAIPFLFAQKGGEVSNNENRTLTSRPHVFDGERFGKFNQNYSDEFESWFKDNMGFRSNLINTYAKLHFDLFKKLDLTDSYYGVNDNWVYATQSILDDYLRLNTRSEDQVKEIGDSYQVIQDWLNAQGIDFYYVQCTDKHTIYPESMMQSIHPLDVEESKTDQVMNYLEKNTSVNSIYLKDTMLKKKTEGYEVYSHWGDPAHWTPRGAYFGYIDIMNAINKNHNNEFKVLQEGDFDISVSDQGKTYFDSIHYIDDLESFAIKNSQAVRGDNSEMGTWGEDPRHRWWLNDNAGNDKVLLIMGDSYINSYIIQNFTQSFYKTYMVWGDYTRNFTDVINQLKPDIVIYECAERVDRSGAVVSLAQTLK